MNSRIETFNILSLFSGGGFLDIGFMNNGFQIQEAVEINPFFISAYNYGISNYCKKSYKNIYKEKIVHPYEIKLPIDLSTVREQKALSLRNNDVEGIIGGPPCQDYSIGGKNAGFKGEKGKLIYSYYNIVKLLKPNFLFFENVAGLYNNKIHKTAFNDIVSKIKSLDYTVWYTILNSLEYGIPQDRSRLVLVAFQKKIIKSLTDNGYKLEFDADKLKKSSNNNYIFKWPKIKFANPKEADWPSKWAFGSRKYNARIEDISSKYKQLLVGHAFDGITNSTPNQEDKFKPYSTRFQLVEEGDTNRKSFKRLHRFRYSPTVAYGNNEVHLHPTKARRLSVRESLRLQSVPDTYVLPADIPLTYKFKLISNGVPTQKANLIAKEIKRTLDIYYSFKEQ